jgi:hypothetical protein
LFEVSDLQIGKAAKILYVYLFDHSIPAILCATTNSVKRQALILSTCLPLPLDCPSLNFPVRDARNRQDSTAAPAAGIVDLLVIHDPSNPN